MTEDLSRSLAFKPATLDPHARTVEVVALSGSAPVTRPAPAPDGTRTAWIEELDAAGADLSRLIGAPALKDHRNAVDSAVGVVASARLDGDQIIASVTFDSSAPASELIGKIDAASVRGVSLGYRVTKWQAAGKRNGLPVFRAVAWTPHELSFTPVPADAGATVRSKGDPMSDITTEQPSEVAAPQNRAAINAEIRSIARLSSLPQTWVDAQIDGDVTIEAARAAAFAEMAKRSGPALNTTRVEVGTDYNDPTMIRSAMADALAARIDPANCKPEGRAREYAGWGVADMVAELARTRGEKVDHRNRHAMVDAVFSRSASLSSSDFPLILESATNKALLAPYQLAAPTFTKWASQKSFNDFKKHSFYRVSDFPGMQEVEAEGGELKYGTLSENREQVSAKEWAVGIALGRRMLINDDLGALSDFVSMAATRFAIDQNTKMYGMLTANSGAGPVLADGDNVFDTDHHTAAASGTALDATNINLALIEFSKLTSLDGLKLNLRPKYLLVGPSREMAARQLLTTIVPNSTSAVNPFSGAFELIVDANIETNAFYLIADPAVAPTFVHGYVNGGQTGPSAKSEIDFDTLAVKLRIGMDWGYGAIGRVGVYRNAGN